MRSTAVAFLLASGILSAQERGPNVAAQKAAMQKLAFLAGQWSGPASVTRGPGPPIQLTQSEDVQFKLDGLVLLIEGTGRDSNGQVVFNALATISFDDASGTYRFRSHSSGRYLETDLKLVDQGFEWGFTAGPAKVRNVMKLNGKGQWQEFTEVEYGGRPPQKTLDMTLDRK